MKIILPDDIQRLCDEINRCGYNTYIIGSSLRAVVFGYDVDKWDIITSATPDELHSIFNKSEIFSILQMSETEKYGVSVIRSKGQSIELSTMRQDGKYNRYSKKASYTTDIMCDLARRDFTINAIAYDTKDHKIIDSPLSHAFPIIFGYVIRCIVIQHYCYKCKNGIKHNSF